MNTYTANRRRRRRKHSLSQIRASSPSFYYFRALLLYFYPHTHALTRKPAHLKNFTLWKDIYPEFFLPQKAAHTALGIFPPEQTVCFRRRGQDPFYGRKLWLLPRRLEIGEFFPKWSERAEVITIFQLLPLSFKNPQKTPIFQKNILGPQFV